MKTCSLLCILVAALVPLTAEELSGPATELVRTERGIVRGQSDLPAELRDTSGLAHAAYGLFEGGVVLVRPDGYIGYRNNNFDLENLQTYLARIFVQTSRSEAPAL